MYKPKKLGNCYNYKPSNEDTHLANDPGEVLSNCNACVFFSPQNCVHRCSFENDVNVI